MVNMQSICELCNFRNPQRQLCCSTCKVATIWQVKQKFNWFGSSAELLIRVIPKQILGPIGTFSNPAELEPRLPYIKCGARDLINPLRCRSAISNVTAFFLQKTLNFIHIFHLPPQRVAPETCSRSETPSAWLDRHLSESFPSQRADSITRKMRAPRPRFYSFFKLTYTN